MQFTTQSNIIEIHLPDGRTITGQRGSTAEDFLNILNEEGQPLIVGAVINGELHELTRKINMESRVQPITLADSDGSRIYRRSLTFLLEAAFSNLFPEVSLYIDHSVSSGGYYCHIHGRKNLSIDDLIQVENEMKRLVSLDLPLIRNEASLEEAISLFEKQKADDKVRLMRYRSKSYVTLYSLDNQVDYHHGYMVPSTRYLKWFGLVSSNGGFTLRFPRRHTPWVIEPMEDYPQLMNAFRLYGNWLEKLGIESVGALDDAIRSGRSREVILVSEALHEQHITSIASQIANHKGKTRLVLISGPSSSGKTTFSRRLAVQLLALGLSPYALELDNFFIDRELTPKDENGQFDFETIDALDLSSLGTKLQSLIDGDEVQLPRYNFRDGRQEPGDVVRLKQDQIIILEGIHGLNPRLIPVPLTGRSFKIYTSALTQLNLDRHNRVSTTDTRLIRRIVRDARERGYNAAQTISRWESVRRGEKRHIFPHQENADVMFNSALAYELAVLRPMIEPLLRQVPFGTPEFIETKRLLAFLEWFLEMDLEWVPDNSILREFVGGSILKDFKLWGS